MRLGRQTTDPKTETIKVRMNAEMKRHIESHAKSRGVGESEYVRSLIAKDMRNP